MKIEGKHKYLLLKTVQEDGILPLTSVCNLSCKFCSHRYNPPGVEVYRFGHLPMELIMELIDYIPPDGPLILGESATKIIEGDPLAHPHFRGVLTMLREKWPDKLLKITTSGTHLSRDMIEFLKEVNPVELNISLNCSSPEERVFFNG